MLGIYPGFGGEQTLLEFERDLGRPLAVVVQFGGHRDPSDLLGSYRGALRGLRRWLARGELYAVTVPLAFGDGDARAEGSRAAGRNALEETAGGAHDETYRAVGRLLVDSGVPDAVLRIGHEFDGDWYPWSAQGNCEHFINAFRHVVDVFRSVSPEFRMDWSGTVPHFREWGRCAYPGDEYVDVIGIDVYDRVGSMKDFAPDDETWHDPEAVWHERILPTLREHRAFAIRRNKPVSFPEWGLATASGVEGRAFGGDNPTFVRSMARWLRALPEHGPGSLAYHAYFLGSDAHDIRGLPNAHAAFVDEFAR